MSVKVKMNFHFIPFGSDCSPAAALRNLSLREFALPFDWIVSNVHILETCLKDKFSIFNTQLKMNHTKTRMIDAYGFQFPHDYPLQKENMTESEKTDSIGEGVYGESTICDTWMEYYDVVMEKYLRRIKRFYNCMNDRSTPIIVLCRYNSADVLRLQTILTTHFSRTDIYFVNSNSRSMGTFDKIVQIYTEKNSVWNEAAIWKQGVDTIMK